MISGNLLKSSLFLLFLFFVSSFLTASAQILNQPEWQLLGNVKIIPTSESATIKPVKEYKDSVFRKVRLKISEGSLKVREVKIYMSDGHVIKSGIQKILKNGMVTRELIIPDHRHSIKKIVVLFKAPMTHSIAISAFGKELLEEYSES